MVKKKPVESKWLPRQFDDLVQAIIRPPRAQYNVAKLGPRRFNFCSKTFVRHDFILVNSRGLALRCSHWQPHVVDRSADELPCVIFTHGNSSSRVEALNHLPACLGMGMTLFAFDFSGSGKSEGAYVSLGFYEKDDLRVVVDHLRGSGTVSSLAVWGRSMGAVTALLYQHDDRLLLGPGQSSVDAFVLDSPFADFTQLAEELVKKGQREVPKDVVVPSLMTSLVLSMVSQTIKSVAGFDVKDLSPIAFTDKCFLPALFICAANDDFVGPHHVEALHAKYHGPKALVVENGDHNSLRSIDAQLAAASFLQRVLVVPRAWTLIPTNPQNAALYLTIPWEPCTAYPSTALGVSHGSTYTHPTSDSESDDDDGDGSVISTSSSASSKSLSTTTTAPPQLPSTFLTKKKKKKKKLPKKYDFFAAMKKKKLMTAEDRERRKKAHYYCNRGNALEEAGNLTAAIRAYQAAIAFDDEYADAHYNLGIALKATGNVDDAVVHYKRTLALCPSHSDAENNLGVVYEDRGDLETALDWYRKAVGHDPLHCEARINLADLLQSTGHYDAAIPEYEIAVKDHPEDADAWNNLGVALEASGNVEAALEKYTQAVGCGFFHWDAQSNLADLLHVTKKFHEAAAAYKVLLDRDPSDARVAASMGHALQAIHDFDGSLRAFQQAIAYDPNEITYNNIGTVYQALQRPEEACQAYRLALQVDPSYAMAHFNLGVSLQSQKNHVDAEASYRKAIALKPSYADPLNNLGLLLEPTDLSRALYLYVQALDADRDFDNARLNLHRVLRSILDTDVLATSSTAGVDRSSSSDDDEAPLTVLMPQITATIFKERRSVVEFQVETDDDEITLLTENDDDHRNVVEFHKVHSSSSSSSSSSKKKNSDFTFTSYFHSTQSEDA